MEQLNVANLNTKEELGLSLAILSILCQESSRNDNNRFFGSFRKPSKLQRSLKHDFDRVFDKFAV